MSSPQSGPLFLLVQLCLAVVLIYWLWIGYRTLLAHQRIVAALHGQVRAQQARFPWGWLGLVLAVALLWIMFWSALSIEGSYWLLLGISPLALIGGQRLQAAKLSLWRLALALPLHCGGSALFVLERLTRWETSSADNLAYQRSVDWILWAESYALPWVQQALQRSDCGLRVVDSRNLNEFPDLAGWPLGILAISCWVAAGVIAFQGKGTKFLSTSLLWFTLFFLPAWLVVERGDIGTGGVSKQSGKPLSPTSFQLAEQRVLDQAYTLGIPTMRHAHFEIVDSQQKRIGRLHVHSFEERHPWRRWKFDLLQGPLRTQPRLTYFLLEDELGAPGLLYQGLGQVWRSPLNQVEGWSDRQREALGLTELR